MKFYKTDNTRWYKSESGKWIDIEMEYDVEEYFPGRGFAPEVLEQVTDKSLLRELHWIYYGTAIAWVIIFALAAVVIKLITYLIMVTFTFNCEGQTVEPWKDKADTFKVTCNNPDVSFKVVGDEDLKPDGVYANSYLPTTSNYEIIQGE